MNKQTNELTKEVAGRFMLVITSILIDGGT